jgi:lipoate-protein ligase B
VPCGIADFGVTSMHALGVKASMQDVDEKFKAQVKNVFLVTS